MTSSRLRRVLLFGLLGLILLTGAAAWISECLLTGPKPAAIGPPPPDLHGEQVSFASASGATIHGWYAAGAQGGGAVLLLHGVYSNRLAMLPRARWLHALGYAVLLIDFQASGESSGDAVTFGWREAKDAAAAVAYLRSRAPGERIGVIGTSMGGAATLLADPPLSVDAVVLEQVYPTIDQATRNRIAIYLGSHMTWLAPAMLTPTSWRLGLRPEQLRPIERISAFAPPKLIVGGDADRHTLPTETMAMYAAAAAPKQLWIVHGAEHVDLYHYAGDDYRQRVGAFLQRWLRPNDDAAAKGAAASPENPVATPETRP